MKKSLSLLALGVTLFSLNSCLDDDSGSYYSVGMGTLLKTQRQYAIAFDGAEGTYAIPDSSLIVLRGLQKPGQRVIAMFNPIDNRRHMGSIQLRDLVEVLTKPLTKAPATPGESEKLGNNLTHVTEAWMAGGCLNVKFCVPTSYYTVRPHLMNAYDTGQNNSQGYRIIDFRHHLNGNLPQIWSNFNYVSFTLPADPQVKGYVLRYQFSKNEKRYIRVN